jgi:hypothetical protein
MNVDFNFDKVKVEVNISIVQMESCVSMSLGVRDERWIDRLSDEDLNFLKRFVLASGSLKAVAAEYRITYPTVRLRLDRLIAKIQVFDSERITSEFERQVRGMHAEGRIDLATMKRLLELHRQEIESRSEEVP